jgi:sarcosine oxidase, subunit delta
MLLLDCPWCGPRDEEEFTCGGQSHITRPAPPVAVDDEEWAQYLFFRNNPKGIEHERWCHRYGCGQWFNLVRHTVTHEIVASYRMADPKPGLP